MREFCSAKGVLYQGFSLLTANRPVLAAAELARIVIRHQRTVPEITVYRMFQGRLTPTEVLQQAEQGNRTETTRKDCLFYSHLYVGLYLEAAGENELARKHIEIAATQHYAPHYMGAVARIHLQRLKATR